jgi:hypothetical protein
MAYGTGYGPGYGPGYARAGIVSDEPIFTGPGISDLTLLVNEAMSPRDYSGRFFDTDSLTFSIVGVLPTGLSLSSDGILSGTPTVLGTTAGLVIQASDGTDTVDSNAFSITISDSLGPTKAVEGTGIEGLSVEGPGICG